MENKQDIEKAAEEYFFNKLKELKLGVSELYPEKIVEMLIQFAASQNNTNEAVEFAEWIQKNNYAMGEPDLWHKLFTNGEERKKYTTQELYKLFKQPRQ